MELWLLCLALNIFYEARGESDEGQLAVGHTTINRARVKGRNLCEEVYSPHQFSWTHQIKLPPSAEDPAWIKAQQIAQLSYQTKDPTGGALWYHHTGITPWWVWNKKVTTVIGNHVFYVCKKKHKCDWN